MNLFERDIAIDLGTSSTLLFEQGKGVVAREPTVVAVDKFSGKILKIGQDAQKMLGRTPANIVAIHPVNAGVISDYEITAQMLRELVSRITSFSLFKPCVLACVPSSITGVEERAMIDAAIDITKADGHMVIDIGGGTTEVAVVSGGGVVECQSIKVAGTSFDESIVKFIRRKYDLLIGLSTAEELKRNIGCVIQRPDISFEEIKGRDLSNGLPKTVRVSSTELIEAFVEPMNHILDAIRLVLESTPPQLVGDLDKNGIIMSGGGSLIYGIDKLIERSTGIRTLVVDDAVSCAAYGAGKMLMHLDMLQDGMMNFYRKRQLKG